MVPCASCVTDTAVSLPVVFPTWPACGGRTTYLAGFERGTHSWNYTSGRTDDPAALLAGLAAGTVFLDEFDRTDSDKVRAPTYAAALLVAREPPVAEGGR
jgi:hypothetical protein